MRAGVAVVGAAISVAVVACGPVEEAPPPATPVIVVQQQPPQIVQPAPQQQPQPQDAVQAPAQPQPQVVGDELAPRPRLSRTITLGQNNEHPVFEGPSRVQGPIAQADPYATTFRYSPYYNHTQTYYAPAYYRGGYCVPRVRYHGVAARVQGPAPPPTTPPVGGDWPRAPIGAGGGLSSPSYPQVSASVAAGPALGGGSRSNGGGSSGSILR